MLFVIFIFFFFNDTATTEIYTLSLHDALPIYLACVRQGPGKSVLIIRFQEIVNSVHFECTNGVRIVSCDEDINGRDRKSTRLNSSHSQISYAVFCLKKKKKHIHQLQRLSLFYN